MKITRGERARDRNRSRKRWRGGGDAGSIRFERNQNGKEGLEESGRTGCERVNERHVAERRGEEERECW